MVKNMSGKKIKILWRGIFNNNRQLITKYAHAYSDKQAFLCMCGQIAKDQNVTKAFIINYFVNKQNSYKITIEATYKEMEG
jgi:hypothetical protein